MAVLTQCVECGDPVSSEAASCPHCSRYPRLVKCDSCDQGVKASESISLAQSRFLHKSCYESLVSATFQCPVCHNNLEYRILIPAKNTCPKCGQSLDLFACESCGLPVLRSDHITVTLNDSGSTRRVHRSCAVKHNVSKHSGSGVALVLLLLLSSVICILILSNTRVMGTFERSPNTPTSSPRKVMAKLTGAAEAPGPGDSRGRGTAQITLDPDKSEVCYDLTVTDVSSATVAHIHEGAVGTEGPVKVLLVTPMASSTKGCKSADAVLVKAIMQNPTNYYVNVHSAIHSKGAVRGQLSAQ